jgi:hypothetical protein
MYEQYECELNLILTRYMGHVLDFKKFDKMCTDPGQNKGRDRLLVINPKQVGQ